MGRLAGSSEVRVGPKGMAGIRNLLHIWARVLTGRTSPRFPRGALEDKVLYAAYLNGS